MTRDIAPYSGIRCERRLTEPGGASDLETSCALGARKKKRRHCIILYDALLPCKRGAVEATSLRPPCPRAAPPPWRGRSAAAAWSSRARSRVRSAPGAADDT